MGEPLTQMKILIVEDQQDSRALLRNMLSELGASQVFEASNGREGMRFVDSAFDGLDMVICDWNMPNMTGMEFLRQFRSADTHTPFLMVTGRADMNSVVEAKNAGVTAYIRKPFSIKQLEAKLRIVIKRAEMVG